MAKRKIEIFEEIHNEKEFDNALKVHENALICAEIYCYFAGSCTALDRLFNTIKLDWSSGKMILLKVPADEIEVFERFRDQSEPVYMFILRGKATKVFRGVNNLKFAEVAKQELNYFNKEQEGIDFNRPIYELSQPTPDEIVWLHKLSMEKQQEFATIASKRASLQAARKKHRAELMIPHLQQFNFVLFWPHCVHAHPELYERWDANNIIMVGREELQLDEDTARDILYAGDATLNEASLDKLLSGRALAICFRLLDDDKHFVSLVRKILYEDLPVYDESKPLAEQVPRVEAFDYYKTFSPTREQVWERRRQERIRLKEEKLEKRTRRLSEMKRLAAQAIDDAKEAQRAKKEQRKLELLKSGNLTALKQLEDESDEEIDIVIPEELADDTSSDESLEEDENEYLPPAGLLIPGFYSPPNDVAKTNGLAVLFPKIVQENVTPEPEFLPPHVLVMLEIHKRYKAIQAIAKRKSDIIHMGIFKGSTPYDSSHIAYTVEQFDTMDITENLDEIKIVFMISTKSDLAVLELMELNPSHVSRDERRGEDECATMFPLGYGDNYDEFQDFNNINITE